MKAVHSFWTAPANGNIAKFSSGWENTKYHMYAWVISTGQAKKIFGNSHMVTDSCGKKILDKLKLKFDSISTELDNISNVPSSLWAYGKIIAYGLQDEPFLHIDSDVFIWQHLPIEFLSKQVVVQELEFPPMWDFENIYLKHRRTILEKMRHIPDCYKEDSLGLDGALNCGIFGGNNIDAIKTYVSEVKMLVEHPENRATWHELNSSGYLGAFNCTIEQQLLWMSLKKQNVNYRPLLWPYKNDDENYMKLGYTHHASKRFDHSEAPGSFLYRMKKRMIREYPEQYEIISNDGYL